MELYRGLAGVSPQACTPNLAMLNNLAAFCRRWGVDRGVGGCPRRRWSCIAGCFDSQAYTPDLVASLNNLASYLSEVGSEMERCGGPRGGGAVYRGLAEASRRLTPRTWLGRWTNLVNRLSEVGSEVLVAPRGAGGVSGNAPWAGLHACSGYESSVGYR